MSRYHRQSILPDFGPEAEAKLAIGHVMVVGAGALGCPALDLLARAGIGTLSIVDRDVVELTNLQRQTLYTEADIGKPKPEAAAARLRAVNSTLIVNAITEDLTAENVEPLLLTHPRVSVILDCTDNFQTRYLLNDAAVKHAIPLVYGGAVATQGVQLTIRPGEGGTACLRCLFPQPPSPAASPTCDTAGIFAPVSTIIGANQASDAIKLLVAPQTLSGTMLSFDLWANQRSRIDLKAAKDPQCPCCGQRCFEYLHAPALIEPKVLCGRNAVQVPAPNGAVNLPALNTRLATSGRFTLSTSLLSGTLTDGTPLTIFPDGRAIIGNTTDPTHARSIYARYIGS